MPEPMNEQTILDRLEPELVERMTSRRDALRGLGRLGLGAAFASVPVGLAAMATKAFAQAALPQAVVDVLNFALTLEYLESEFYTTGTGTSGLIPASDRQTFVIIREHEQAHVDFLKGALGSSAVAKPTFDFTAGGMFDPFGDYATFVTLSTAFEDTGVRAYKGQAPALMDTPDILTAALTIHSVEAHHAAKVRRMSQSYAKQGWIPLNQPGAPAAVAPVYAGEEETMEGGVDVTTLVDDSVSDESVTEAFDEPLTMQQVLAIVNPFLAS